MFLLSIDTTQNKNRHEHYFRKGTTAINSSEFVLFWNCGSNEDKKGITNFNQKIIEVGRELLGPYNPTPLLNSRELEQFAGNLVQLGFQCLKEQIHHNLS